MNNEQKVLSCIKEGMTDRQAIADKCGMKRNQVMSTYRHLQAKGLIERTTEQQQLGRGKGSLPSVYRVVGEKPIYRGTFSHVSSIFNVGANA